MSKRKTISVAEVAYTVNNILQDSAYDDDRHRQYRMGMCVLLEDILHKTGNYKGYRYLLESEVPPDCRPGVNYEVNTQGHFVPCEDYERRFFDTDETRRQYHLA